MEFPEGEELSKLLIKNDLKNNSEKEKLDKALKYQILDKNTALFSEIELSNQITEEMKTKIIGDEEKNVMEIYKPKEYSYNNEHYINDNYNYNMNSNPIYSMRNHYSMGLNSMMQMGNSYPMNTMSMGMNPMMNFMPIAMNSSPIGMSGMNPMNAMGMNSMMSMNMNYNQMGINPMMSMGMNNPMQMQMPMGMMNNNMNVMMGNPITHAESEEYKRLKRITGYMVGKKMDEERKKRQEEQNKEETSSSNISNEEEEKKKKILEEKNKKIQEEKEKEKKYEEESRIKKAELERKKLEEKEKLMKIIKTQDYIDGYWDVNEMTKFIFEKYKKEYELLKDKNFDDKVAMTILMIYYLKNEHFELLTELVMIIKKGEVYIKKETKSSYEEIIEKIK